MSTVTEVRCPDCGSTSPYTDEDGCCKTCGGDCEVTTHQYGGVVRELRNMDAFDAVFCTIDRRTIEGIIALRDAINAALHEYRYEWVECEICEGKSGPISDPSTAYCSNCADHAEWGLEPGQVRQKCETCHGLGEIHEAPTMGNPDDPAPPVECPRIAEGRCKDGYAIKGVG